MKTRFDQLRRKAAEKRDQQIRAAKAEFKATCRHIDTPDRKLPVKRQGKVRGHRFANTQAADGLHHGVHRRWRPFTSPQLIEAIRDATRNGKPNTNASGEPLAT